MNLIFKRHFYFQNWYHSDPNTRLVNIFISNFIFTQSNKLRLDDK